VCVCVGNEIHVVSLFAHIARAKLHAGDRPRFDRSRANKVIISGGFSIIPSGTCPSARQRDDALS
jgi:hypothetical protein